MNHMGDAARLIASEEPAVPVRAGGELPQLLVRHRGAELAPTSLSDDALLVEEIAPEFVDGSGLTFDM